MIFRILAGQMQQDGSFIDNPRYPELNEKLDELAERYGTTKAGIAEAWLLWHGTHFGTTRFDTVSSSLFPDETRLIFWESDMISYGNNLLYSADIRKYHLLSRGTVHLFLMSFPVILYV